VVFRIKFNRWAVTGAVALLLTGLALVLAAGVAHGTDEPAQRGAACTNVGEYRKNRSGTEYVCEQRRGDDCPVWHAAHPKKGPWPKPWPCICPSKSASVSPSPSRSVTPGQSTTSSTPPVDTPAPGATPVGNILPVTGLPTVVVGATTVGVLLILAGLILLVVSLRRPNPRPRRNGS